MRVDNSLENLNLHINQNETDSVKDSAQIVSDGESGSKTTQHTGRNMLIDKEFICPYCHKKISVRDLLFRAENPETEASILRKTSPSSPEYAELKRFEAREDVLLSNHWEEKMHWSRGSGAIRESGEVYFEARTESDTVGDENKDSKVNTTDGTSVFDVKCHILEDDQIVWDKTVLIDGGYPIEVTDTRGETTSTRLCPKCHCILPHSYGRFKTVFIACVGIMGSGKTVLLSKFFETMNSTLPRYADVAPLSTGADKFVEQKAVKANEVLPVHTDPETIKPPVIVHMATKDKGETTTFVFYDVAGENCTKPEQMEKKCFFMKNIDGIIMMISPKQIPENENDVGVKAEVLKVLDCIGDAFFDKALLNGEQKSIEFAVVLSMSDEYKRRENADEFQCSRYDYMYEPIPYSKKRKGYMLENHDKMNLNIKNTLESTALLEVLRVKKHNAAFFAVSALGSAPKRYGDANSSTSASDEKWIAPEEIKTIRLEEPFLWLLYKFGVIPAITELSLTEKIILWIKRKLEALKGDTEK